MFAGFALSVWSTAIMYASYISDRKFVFNAYLLGYAFPPILSGLIILLSITVLRSNYGRGSLSPSESNLPIENSGRIDKSHRSVGTSFLKVGSQIRNHHISYYEKLGTSTFYLGLIILFVSRLLTSENVNTRRSSL